MSIKIIRLDVKFALLICTRISSNNSTIKSVKN